MKLTRTGIIILTLLAATAITPALATKPPAPMASMLVTGSISVSAKGWVTHYQLDQADKLPQAVVGMLNTAIPDWRFKPVMRDGKAVPARSRMSLRVLATPVGNQHYRLSLSSSFFGSYNAPGTLQEDNIKPPKYPRIASGDMVQGIVYLLLRVNRDGHVDKVAARKVNLRNSAEAGEMQTWRHELTRAAVHAARQWRFKIPTKGPEAKQPYWYATIPVEFSAGPDTYGRWYTYYPGPVQFIPWADKTQLARGSIDSQIPGMFYTGHQSLQRKSAPGS